MCVGLLQANYPGEITKAKKKRDFAFNEIKEQCLFSYLSVDWHVTLICLSFSGSNKKCFQVFDFVRQTEV